MTRPTLALLLCFTALPCAAQPPAGVGVVDVTLSPAEITVGDHIEARLTLVWTGPEPTAEPLFSGWGNSWGDAEVLSAGDLEMVAGPGARRVYTQELVVTAFTTGEIRLPAIIVVVPLGAETVEVPSGGELSFNVRSILPEDAGELEPRPPAPPRRLAAEARFAWTVSGLGGLSLLLAWLVARRLRAPGAGVAPAATEPLAQLLYRLQHLDPTAAEPAHTGLSMGLRDFLGRSFDFPAAESTTTEIEHRLRQARVEPETTGGTVGLLRDCDQVKFAQSPVAARVTLSRLRQARELGHRIDRRLRPWKETDP